MHHTLLLEIAVSTITAEYAGRGIDGVQRNPGTALASHSGGWALEIKSANNL